MAREMRDTLPQPGGFRNCDILSQAGPDTLCLRAQTREFGQAVFEMMPDPQFARLLRRGLAPVEMTKAARDLCRAAFGDELPGTPVPFIT